MWLLQRGVPAAAPSAQLILAPNSRVGAQACAKRIVRGRAAARAAVGHDEDVQPPQRRRRQPLQRRSAEQAAQHSTATQSAPSPLTPHHGLGVQDTPQAQQPAQPQQQQQQQRPTSKPQQFQRPPQQQQQQQGGQRLMPSGPAQQQPPGGPPHSRHPGGKQGPRRQAPALAPQAAEQQPEVPADLRLRLADCGAMSPPTQGNSRPQLRHLVIVEGDSDRAAVLAAVRAQVYVLDGVAFAASHRGLKKGLEESRRADLLLQAALCRSAVIVLMDPDVAGRQGRALVEELLGLRCWHAFVPAPDATSVHRRGNHAAGNVGVEHASPATVLLAISKARRAQQGRAEFCRQELIDWGLSHPMDLPRGLGNAPGLRRCLGGLLGIGICNGKQLLKQLNNYGFTRAEVEEALALARVQLESEAAATAATAGGL